MFDFNLVRHLKDRFSCDKTDNQNKWYGEDVAHSPEIIKFCLFVLRLNVQRPGQLFKATLA